MRRRHCRGVAAVECALVLTVCALLLASCLYYGRLAMAGAVLDRAASDAARYLASVPVENLRDSARRATVLAAAQAMLEQALAGSGIQVLELQVAYQCGMMPCALVTAATPLPTVSVAAVLQYHDERLGPDGDVELQAYAESGRGN